MTRSELPALHGILVVDKPAGITSHDVVDRVRKLTGVQRVGHAGTLDPFATGVLVVAVGKATRLLRYISDSPKRYLAQVVLGVETDSCDLEGSITRVEYRDEWPSVNELEQQRASFMGMIEQTPPVYSAIKIDGKRAYERARAGEQVKIPTRQVRIDSLDIVRYAAPDLYIDIACSTGTYIRSLARDIGNSLGTGGYCHALRRTQVGHYHLSQAWNLDELSEIEVRSSWSQIAMHPASVIPSCDAIVLSTEDSIYWLNGRKITLKNGPANTSASVRVYSCLGQFLGLGQINSAVVLTPELVFQTTT